MKIITKSRAGIGCHYRARVVDAEGNPVTEWGRPVHNLILPTHFHNRISGRNIRNILDESRCNAGDGNTPNAVALDGTFGQTGTTVTRASGSGEFAAGDVNKFIRFTGGAIAEIISFTSVTEVEVDRSQEIAATGLSLYNTIRTSLDNSLKGTITYVYNGSTKNADPDTSTDFVATYTFATETSDTTYEEVGLSHSSSALNIYSRAVIDPLLVPESLALQVQVTLTARWDDIASETSVVHGINGWPHPYEIVEVVDDGTNWDIEVDDVVDDHYVVGEDITISGTADHDGTFEIVSFPANNIIRVANAAEPVSNGAGGTVVNDDSATLHIWGGGFSQQLSTSAGVREEGSYGDFCINTSTWPTRCRLYEEANMVVPNGWDGTPASGTFLQSVIMTKVSYDNATRTCRKRAFFGSGQGTSKTIRQIAFGWNTVSENGTLVLTFAQRQRKHADFSMSWEYRIAWDPTLDPV